MRGVILAGELVGREGGVTDEALVFVELVDGDLFVRRNYGARSVGITFELDAVEAALAALKAEAARRPTEGGT